jgi:hypothetical protein
MELRYFNQICYLASMHKKENAIAIPFKKFLGCKVIAPEINTDLFGTFTGEIERKSSPLECAKQKCLKGLEISGGTLAIASEGSFCPHPSMPFISADFEVLFFKDLDLEFELTLTKISSNTNFSKKVIDTLEELNQFADNALFPSHAINLSPHDSQKPNILFKGIQDRIELFQVFQECKKISKHAKVLVETDMRAHKNPTRMKVIEQLSYEMAARLTSTCPSCKTPGWGLSKSNPGLACKACKMPTELINSQNFACCKCTYEETIDMQQKLAEPEFCAFCNP